CASSNVSASTHHSSARVTSIVAWKSFVCGCSFSFRATDIFGPITNQREKLISSPHRRARTEWQPPYFPLTTVKCPAVDSGRAVARFILIPVIGLVFVGVSSVAPRAYWKGYLKLSLVSCSVALYPATSEREKISFHQLNKETGNRIRYRKVDA